MSCVVLSRHHGAPAQTPCSTAALCALPDTAGWRHGGGSRVNQNPRYCPLLNCCTILESSDIEYSIYEKKQNATVVLAPFNKTHFHFYIR